MIVNCVLANNVRLNSLKINQDLFKMVCVPLSELYLNVTQSYSYKAGGVLLCFQQTLKAYSKEDMDGQKGH